jgi:hypothetical protein
MTVERLVRFEAPEARETPVLLLAQLREIDATAELVYAGEGRWWLGAVSANEERRKRAEMMMAQIERLEVAQRAARTLMLCHLNLQGFALIEAYHGRDPMGTVLVNPGPDEYHCTIVEDFRERDANFRRDQGRGVFTTRLEASMKEPERREAEARMKEYLATDGREHYARHMRNRVQVGGDGAAAYAAKSSLILPPSSPLILGVR